MIDRLKELDNAYYNTDAPLVSDAEYDSLKRRVLKDNPDYKNAIGATVPGGRDKILHREKMLSLGNVFSSAEIDKWYASLPSNTSVIVEPKHDGLAVSLIYINGKLSSAATRGDGLIGEDIMSGISHIESVPSKLVTDTELVGRLDVRGEVVMLKSVFNAYNMNALSKGLPVLSNPRNAAAGTLRRKHIDPNDIRTLAFIPYDCLGDIDVVLYSSRMQQLSLYGFTMANLPIVIDNPLAEGSVIHIDKRNTIPWEIDGVVFKADDYSVRNKLGSTSSVPKWAIAYKFPADHGITKLLSVEWQVGKVGTVTPVAILEPITLSGVTVTRSTLHNWDEIQRLGIRVGDYVKIKRAADVIPKITGVDTTSDKSTIIPHPTHCPSCNSVLKHYPTDVSIRCINGLNCKGQVLRLITHFASRDAMNIDGVGPSLVKQLLEAKLITRAVGLYSLSVDDLLKLPRFGSTKAIKIVNSITLSKNTTMSRFIYSLGIPDVGRSASRIIESKCGNMGNLYKLSVTDLTNTPDIGEVIANRLYDYLVKERSYIDELLSVGLSWVVPTTNLGNKLDGMSFVLTGAFKQAKRSSVSDYIKTNGGKVTGSVSSKTTYLIVGDNPGSKLKQAKELGVNIVNEDKGYSIIGCNAVDL